MVLAKAGREKNLRERPGSFFYTTLPPTAKTGSPSLWNHREGTHRTGSLFANTFKGKTKQKGSSYCFLAFWTAIQAVSFRRQITLRGSQKTTGVVVPAIILIAV